ncbi:energy-coupling factor transport system permease protein [Thermosporothrix hazakensis]|jgi:energy-coupling factor transport system permease protein|uniref:Energy-coupling factor transport system permease protein n=2 Tax=Thermosporothrix TaxID=768650 RepID=A0A326UCX7_THEHA|nr:energy-coupling factor transporter transmembrane component T [Thermosporothrix hazakensis]PZW32564.1 energy-coupling factor transport system permease protein [Thermosporothrix hazakensis]BBH87460.1 putative HMP/thiamine permease protein YkoC [Thermosporothrix sp. COM3]GCE49917.1 putative HMP/thiamine permease protein YkoC [Thermosporothrix hazakensis]
MQMIYQEVDSPLHRLNPLSKVLALVPIVLFVALTTDPWVPLVFLVLAVVIILGPARVSLRTFGRINVPLFLAMVSFMVTYPFLVRAELFNHSPVFLQLGPITVYQAAVVSGAAAVLRVYAMFLLSLIFTFTTDISDFIRALVQQWKFPYKLGYGVLAAFRFVPMLQSEFRLIQAAHKIRGIEDRGGLRVQYERLRRYIIPLLATAIRRAERTALAMDGRAFGVLARRSYFKQFRFHGRDYLFIASFWLLCLLLIGICWYAGWLGPLSLLKNL